VAIINGGIVLRTLDPNPFSADNEGRYLTFHSRSPKEQINCRISVGRSPILKMDVRPGEIYPPKTSVSPLKRGDIEGWTNTIDAFSRLWGLGRDEMEEIGNLSVGSEMEVSSEGSKDGLVM
jgi:hypothetical protein